jgi:hypothetical protein
MSLISLLPPDIQRAVAFYLSKDELNRYPSKVLENEDDIFWRQKLIQTINTQIQPQTFKSIYEYAKYVSPLIEEDCSWTEKYIHKRMNDEVFLKKYVDTYDWYGYTIFGWLCHHDCPKKDGYIQKLLKYIDVRRTQYGCSYLSSCQGIDENLFKTIIKMGADINFQDDEGFTVLMDAVYDDKPSVVKILLEAGADKNLKNSDGRSALDIAIMLINDDKWKKRTFCRNSGLIIIL